MILFIKLLKESFVFALGAIITNKVRTLLSLLGITIGIFCIISVFTVFDSMEMAIQKNFDSLGENVIFITKWPLIGDGNTPWWKYWNRPQPSIQEMKEIQKRSMGVESISIFTNFNKTVKYGSISIENTSILACSHDYDQTIFFEIAEGRYFSPLESNNGRNVAIIGHSIAESLFKNAYPIGRKIKVGGRNLDVIGVFAEEGEDNFGDSHDELVMIPVQFARSYVNMKRMNMTMVVKALPHVSNEQLKDELIGIMRSIRSLKPGSENNFDVSEISLLTNYIANIFGVISVVGWIIGGFSLLVGGFGIANIMFVSVKERTTQIGIQKSLGAKKYFILFQFVFEATFLSIFGGIIGLLLIYVGSIIATNATDFDIILTANNIALGLIVSGLIGLVFGFIPSYNAARLNPVDAMRSTF